MTVAIAQHKIQYRGGSYHLVLPKGFIDSKIKRSNLSKKEFLQKEVTISVRKNELVISFNEE